MRHIYVVESILGPKTIRLRDDDGKTQTVNVDQLKLRPGDLGPLGRLGKRGRPKKNRTFEVRINFVQRLPSVENERTEGILALCFPVYSLYYLTSIFLHICCAT